MSSGARTIWVGVVLIVPGGFLFFLAYAFGRALVRAHRAARANRAASIPSPRFLPFTVQDVLREVRASI